MRRSKLGELPAIDLFAMLEPLRQPLDLVRPPAASGRADRVGEQILELAVAADGIARVVHLVIDLLCRRLVLGHPAQLVVRRRHPSPSPSWCSAMRPSRL